MAIYLGTDKVDGSLNIDPGKTVNYIPIIQSGTELGKLNIDGVDKSIYAPSSHAETVSLTVADWSNNSQTITVSGVTTSNSVIVGPAPTSIDDYGEAGIRCTAQAANSLTFTCESTPSEVITVNVLIFT